jgi:hypothetical protein
MSEVLNNYVAMETNDLPLILRPNYLYYPSGLVDGFEAICLGEYID